MCLSTLSCGFGHRFSSTSSWMCSLAKDLLVWQIQAWHWSPVMSCIIYGLEKSDCLWGADWKPSTSTWSNTPQSGHSKERGVWGNYKMINCGWAWNHDCTQCCRYEFWAHCTDFAMYPLKITFSGGWLDPPENIVLDLGLNRWALKLSFISKPASSKNMNCFHQLPALSRSKTHWL